MNFCLVVVKPFSNFLRGEMIKDNNKINKIMQSENADSVVRVMVKEI